MMAKKLEGLLRIGWEKQIILKDQEGLWNRLNVAAAVTKAGYPIHQVADEMMLRYLYENSYRNTENLCLIVLTDRRVQVPFDLESRFHVAELSLESLFPKLSSGILRNLSGIDLRQLAVAMELYTGPAMDDRQTQEFCAVTMFENVYALPYAQQLMDACLETAEGKPSYLNWASIASDYGKALMLIRNSEISSHFCEQMARLQTIFHEWMMKEYGKLSAEANIDQPVLLSGVADNLRRQRGKVALIVIDGMSFENLFTVQRYLSGYDITCSLKGVFSFLPTVTSVARQSLFAGSLPAELSTPLTLQNEEKQWRTFWKAAGLRDEEISFSKNGTLEVDSRHRVIGFVINIVDNLMHNQLQGMRGMARDLETWVEEGSLTRILDELIVAGFQVFLTSDHGNTQALAQRRFYKPGVLAEPASRRAVYYQSFTDARELEDFDVFRYNGTYLPKDSQVWLFGPGACYGDKGKEYITHGGISIEEVIVPFVRIGEHG